MKPQQKEYFQHTRAFDFLNSVDVDGQTFTTSIVMNFLKLKFGEDAFVDGWMTEEQSEAFIRLDKSLDTLFQTFKGQYSSNVLKSVG
jgi:hypothetical protein